MIDKSLRIKESLKETFLKRKSQRPVTYQLKLQVKTKRRKKILSSAFLEAKWFYNHMLFNEEDRIPNTANKISQVQVKVGDTLETRTIAFLGSQVKQEITARLIDNMVGLKNLKENGNKIGILKPKRVVNSIPLVQYGTTYKLDTSKNRVRIQKLGSFRVLGLRQIPDDCEIASAVLLRKPDGFYLNVTTYQNKVRTSTINKPLAVDFGIKDKLFLSNGVGIDFEIPESDRVKKLQKKLSKSTKGGRNREKTLNMLRKAHQQVYNIRKDCQNRVIALFKHYDNVVFQNDPIKSWHEGLFGKQVQYSGVGSIKSRVSATLESISLSATELTTRECFLCGSRLDVTLSDRVISCHNCESKIHRDWNAALNILKKGLDVSHDHILRLDWAEVTPVEWKTYARVFGGNPHIRVSRHCEAGSSRIYS